MSLAGHRLARQRLASSCWVRRILRSDSGKGRWWCGFWLGRAGQCYRGWESSIGTYSWGSCWDHRHSRCLASCSGWYCGYSGVRCCCWSSGVILVRSTPGRRWDWRPGFLGFGGTACLYYTRICLSTKCCWWDPLLLVIPFRQSFVLLCSFIDDRVALILERDFDVLCHDVSVHMSYFWNGTSSIRRVWSQELSHLSPYLPRRGR